MHRGINEEYDGRPEEMKDGQNTRLLSAALSFQYDLHDSCWQLDLKER